MAEDSFMAFLQDMGVMDLLLYGYLIIAIGQCTCGFVGKIPLTWSGTLDMLSAVVGMFLITHFFYPNGEIQYISLTTYWIFRVVMSIILLIALAKIFIHMFKRANYIR